MAVWTSTNEPARPSSAAHTRNSARKATAIPKAASDRRIQRAVPLQQREQRRHRDQEDRDLVRQQGETAEQAGDGDVRQGPAIAQSPGRVQRQQACAQGERLDHVLAVITGQDRIQGGDDSDHGRDHPAPPGIGVAGQPVGQARYQQDVRDADRRGQQAGGADGRGQRGGCVPGDAQPRRLHQEHQRRMDEQRLCVQRQVPFLGDLLGRPGVGGLVVEDVRAGGDVVQQGHRRDAGAEHGQPHVGVPRGPPSPGAQALQEADVRIRDQPHPASGNDESERAGRDQEAQASMTGARPATAKMAAVGANPMA